MSVTVLVLIGIRWACLQSVCVFCLFMYPLTLLLLFFFVCVLILVYSLSLCSFMLAWHVCSELTWPDVGVKLCAVSKCACVCVVFPRDLIWWPFFHVLAVLSAIIDLPLSFCVTPSLWSSVCCVLRGGLRFQHELSSGGSYLAHKRSGDGEGSDSVLEIYHMTAINQRTYTQKKRSSHQCWVYEDVL